MLKGNEDMKFLKVIFFVSLLSEVTYKKDCIPMVCQFLETVLLHPSLCHVVTENSSINYDKHDINKMLITPCK